MNIEELQAMSDNELNELAAVKVMGYHMYHYDKDYEENCYYLLLDGIDAVKPLSRGYKTEEEAWRDWRPTTDMNDAMSLFEEMVKDTKYSDATITYPWYVVAGWNPMSDEGEWEIQVEDDSLPRAITIASILAKEENK